MIGKTLSHYKVLEKIGQGGMGEVYRAEDTNLSRDVAIKVLPEQFTQDPQRLARFEREAKLLASLNHPNIAAIYGFEKADGVHFLALELVPGETLAERVAKGPVPVEEALEICRQIAEGVEAAHEKGVIHRDLKPANVKVTPEGKVKILDFGLAKAFEAEPPVTDISQSPTLTEEMTRAGVILGTAAYMSPEQAKGEAVDKRADIFAFGCVLYELLTAKRTFDGKTITETLAKILEGEPNWKALPATTPLRIKELLQDCLQKEVHNRVHDVSQLRIQIKKALEEPATELPTDVASAAQPGGQRWAMTAGLVVLTAIVAGLAVWFLIQPSAPDQRPATKIAITPSLATPLANTATNDLAISADGRHVLYKANSETGFQLYLHSLDEFVDRPIPGTEAIGARGSPFFSPDGTYVGFFAGEELRKVSLSGGSPITLCDAPAVGLYGSWGSDDTIVFSASDGPIIQLYRVSASGGESEVLASPDPDKGETFYVAPHFLPGGKAVIFAIKRRSDHSQIAVLSLETGEQKILIEAGRQPKYLESGHLIYAQEATGNVMAVSFDLATLEVTSDPVSVLQGVRQSSEAAVDFALSAEGTLAYAPLDTDVQRLVWVDRKGTESVITQEDVSFGTPRISPNGRQIGVAISTIGETQNIWIYDLESESLRRLTFWGGGMVNWSPDGKWIIFQGRDSEGLRAISRQLADGSGPMEHLTVPTPHAQMPQSLTPDGGVVAFNEFGDLWMLQIEDDREPQPFLISPNAEFHPKFSPDGKWIAYVSDELGPRHVYVSPYPKADVKYLVSEGEVGAQPVWSPDGTELFYRSGDQMMTVSVETEPTFRAGRPEVLFEGKYVNSRINPWNPYYDISADGQRFLMIKDVEGRTGQINVIVNWSEELKRLVPSP